MRTSFAYICFSFCSVLQLQRKSWDFLVFWRVSGCVCVSMENRGERIVIIYWSVVWVASSKMVGGGATGLTCDDKYMRQMCRCECVFLWSRAPRLTTYDVWHEVFNSSLHLRTENSKDHWQKKEVSRRVVQRWVTGDWRDRWYVRGRLWVALAARFWRAIESTSSKAPFRKVSKKWLV